MVGGPEVGVGVGVGGFALGAEILLAEAWIEFAAKMIKTRVKTRNVRKTFFVCIEVPHLSGWMGSQIVQKANHYMVVQIFHSPHLWIQHMLPKIEIAKQSTFSQ